MLTNGISRRTAVALFVVVVAVCASVTYLWHCNGDSLDFSDTDVMIVISGSMDGEPREQYGIETIPVESMIFIRDVPSDPDEAESFYASLRVGDVLTFDYRHPVSGEQMVVTHRIVGISEGNGIYTYTLQGDSIADDPTNGSVQVVTSSSGDVIGKVVGVSHWLGVLTVFVSHWYGKVVLILIPCTILIASEVGNIVHTLRGDNGRKSETDGSTCRIDPKRNATKQDAVRGPLSDDILFRRRRSEPRKKEQNRSGRNSGNHSCGGHRTGADATRRLGDVRGERGCRPR